MKSRMFTHLRLFLSILLALASPFLFLMALPDNIKESVEANLFALMIGLVFSLIVGERHFQRHLRSQRQ